MTMALRDCHGAGYLHRDIKPANMCVGFKNKSRIFLIDFGTSSSTVFQSSYRTPSTGMARNYTTLSGRVRPRREACGFRGTQRYASLDVRLASVIITQRNLHRCTARRSRARRAISSRSSTRLLRCQYAIDHRYRTPPPYSNLRCRSKGSLAWSKATKEADIEKEKAATTNDKLCDGMGKPFAEYVEVRVQHVCSHVHSAQPSAVLQ